MNRFIGAMVLGALATASATTSVSAGVVPAAVVFNSGSSGNFFTPFNQSNANTGIRYGDSGWVLGPGQPSIQLSSAVLNLATFGGTTNGTTDLRVTFTDGDPSGLVFGSGNVIRQTTFTNVPLLATGAQPAFFDLVMPLLGAVTAGGFNNVGFSIQALNYNFDGQFGFQTSNITSPGFSTNNASFYNGSSWSLFSFGGPAQFAFQVFAVPAPASAGLLAIGGLVMARRRR